jgi:uncharacterized membrane protein
MLIEKRKKLGDVRPAKQARLAILLLMIIGIGLDWSGRGTHANASGTLMLGLACGILIGPRLPIWKA